MKPQDQAVVDWHVPGTGLDAFFGDGATRIEKTLPTLTGIAAIGILAVYAVSTRDLQWSWWQWLLAVVVTFDLVGGVVANALNSAKRFQHAERIAVPRRSASLVRNHVLFTAIHVQPVIIAVLFPGPGFWWGLLWYALALATVTAVGRVPLYLRRPAAMVVVALTPMLAMLVEHPPGFDWLPAVLITKLVLGAVKEEPYRRPDDRP